MNRKTKTDEFVQSEWDIQITGRNVLVTDAMKTYAMEKISKIEHFKNRIIYATVTMDIQRFEHRVDIVLKLDNVKIVSQGVTDDMYASIDIAVDKMMEQLRRYKTRIQDHHAINHEEIALQVDIYEAPTEEDLVNDDIEDENTKTYENGYKPHKIVAQETRPLRTLTANEAIIRMELSGDKFLIFRDPNSHVKVIYRRDDGNFGMIAVKV